MGALSTRYYIKHLGGESTIETWVSLGGPNHGTYDGEPLLGNLMRGDAAELDVLERAQLRR